LSSLVCSREGQGRELLVIRLAVQKNFQEKNLQMLRIGANKLGKIIENKAPNRPEYRWTEEIILVKLGLL
jgi:hypothetical protein